MRSTVCWSLILLAGTAGLALAAEEGVPAPEPISLEEIPAPSTRSRNPGEHLELLLDALAPLGTVEGNAAEWLADFVRPGGERWDGGWRGELVDSQRGRVFPAGHSILEEAESWTNRARLRLYPDTISIEAPGFGVPFPLFLMRLGRSWWHHGLEAGGEEGRESFRHAIRLGRLLRQDDVTHIQDVMGLVLIRFGLQGFHELAAREGDAETMLLAASAMAEAELVREPDYRDFDPQIDIACGLRTEGRPKLEGVSRRSIEAVLGAVKNGKLARRRRVEALPYVRTVMEAGDRRQREEAREALAELAACDDEILAALARGYLEWEWDRERPLLGCVEMIS